MNASTANGVHADDHLLADVYKDPVTDPGKRSKRGLLVVRKDQSGYRTDRVDRFEDTQGDHNVLERVFYNGRVTRDQALEEIRNLALRRGE
jgi:nicotinamide phosphoribosyltransferase